jgi:hypothetical protein
LSDLGYHHRANDPGKNQFIGCFRAENRARILLEKLRGERYEVLLVAIAQISGSLPSMSAGRRLI